MKVFKYITLSLFAAFMMFTGNVHATDIDVQGFKPHPFGFDASLPTVITGNTVEKGDFTLGFMLNYQRAPLSLWTNNGNTLDRIILKNQLTGDLMFGYGVFSWFDVGISIPVIMYQDGEGFYNEDEPGTFGMGDISLYPRFKLYASSKNFVSVAFIPVVTLPVGHMIDQYMGSSYMTFRPTLAVTARFTETLSVSYDFYYKAVKNEHSPGLDLEDEFGFGVGGVYKLIPDKLDAFVEVFGHSLVNAPFDSRFNSPLEIDAGVKYKLNKNLDVMAGGGAGIVKGYTSPDFRVFAGLAWNGKFNDDPDNDGIKGDKDACPENPEDFDGFEDGDGCPDYDNDKDGIKDSEDKCPLKAEDIDGFEDGDGCPDYDNDKDGIKDSEDKCPGKDADKANKFRNTKENINGFKDKDGCPEPDGDGDGILDEKDQCPRKAEDIDGFEDGDGCPDPDNDGDGIPDKDDKAPGKDADKANNFKNTKEDIDGFKDGDGIPDPDNDADGIPDVKDKCPGKDADMKDGFKKVQEIVNGVKDDDGCPDKGKSLVKITINRIEILQKVYFAFNRSKIKRKSYNLLKQVATILKMHPEIKLVEIAGHTDTLGKAAYNLRLSRKRAAAVKKFLIKRGISSSRLVAKGYGLTKPLRDCSSVKRRRKRRKCEVVNRRVEFNILKTSSKTNVK